MPHEKGDQGLSASQGCGDTGGSLPAANQEGAPQSGDTPFQCAISADVVRRALLCVSSDETRYYLQGVHVSPHPEGGAYVVGTDGRALVIFRDKSAIINGSAILAPDERMREAIEQKRHPYRPRVLFARKDRLYVAEVSHDSADALFEQPGGKVVAAQYVHATIDGTFPDWRKVFFPIDAAGVVPTLNADLLKKMGKALSLSSTRQLQMRPTGSEPSKHPVWVFGDIDYGCGVIMGCVRGAGRMDAPPAWLGDILGADTRAPAGLAAGSQAPGSQQPRDEQSELARKEGQ